MVKNLILLGFFTFFLVYNLVKVNSKIIAKIRNLECFPNSDWFNITCNLKAVNWKKSVVNIDSELKQDLNSIRIHAQVFKRYNTYQPFPISADFEFCSILGGSVTVNYFFEKLLRKLFNDFTNLNHSCPFLKGDKLIARDLDWQSTDFMNYPLPTGSGRYRLDLNLYGNRAKTNAVLIIGHADLTEY